MKTIDSKSSLVADGRQRLERARQEEIAGEDPGRREIGRIRGLLGRLFPALPERFGGPPSPKDEKPPPEALFGKRP